MKAFLNKMKSRKFLTCVAGILTGICMIFGLDEGTINTIAGAIVVAGSAVMYIYSEGKIDAAAVNKIKNAIDEVKDAIDEINNIEE